MSRIKMSGPKKATWSWAALGLTALFGVGNLLGNASCAQTPTNVPVRTFDRPQKVDVVCMKVLVPDPNNPGFEIAIPPQPDVQARCAPVPVHVDGSTLPYHLFALVTQTTRGEIAVVDLTSGAVIDTDHATPGINFLPVGALPTDVAVTPDGALTFVATAETNKPAIYALANRDILGDSQGLPSDQTRPVPKLTSWPVCALPQSPGPIAVIPMLPSPAATGGADAGADAGGGASAPGYTLAVVLPGDGVRSAKVVTIDPTPFLRGANLDRSFGTTVAPGSLVACPITGAIEITGDLPPEFAGGPAWDDGVKYVDGGVALAADAAPPAAASCATTAPGDAGSDGPAAADAGSTFPHVPHKAPHATSAARDGQMLYVADDGVPLIHVIDLSSGVPRELPPLLATSVIDPARKISVSQVAVSPATRDYRRYLYALDKKEGSIIVYDITDGANSPRVPLLRPHPELNPFQPPDRIVFNAPVAALSFVRHDFPLLKEQTVSLTSALTGLQCNPNPNVGVDQGPFTDPGAFYRANVANQEALLGPLRLRGIFALVTLSSGQIVTIDIDDWDAPCRRPDPMDAPISAVAPAEPTPSSSTDFDPYHVPAAFQRNAGGVTTPVSLEAFFPVSAPNRPRSANLLRRDPLQGVHIPNLVGLPQLFASNAPLPTAGEAGLRNPIMLPTTTTLADPSYIKDPTIPDPTLRELVFIDPTVSQKLGAQDPQLSRPVPTASPSVRFGFEDPQVHIDQDWNVTYEGRLPGFEGNATTTLVAQMGTIDNYQSLNLTVPNGLLCRRGVEDFRLGTERANREIAAFQAAGLVAPKRLDHRLSDFVQIADNLLPPDDPYWAEEGNDCWDPQQQGTAQARHDTCLASFGPADDQTTLTASRDFPILEASDDHLVVGRFGQPNNSTAVSEREVVSRDPGNAAFLKVLRCCFHHQVSFHVRTGGQWLTTGSSVGHLHHVTTSASGACVQSCSSRESLLNSRAPALPRTVGDLTKLIPPDRNSPLAMRNPMFAFLMWNGSTVGEAGQLVDATPTRDLIWKFTVRGQFAPLTINLAATTTALSPQSMLFIDSLQQLAVVDGSSQGLILIDLNTVAAAHAPYF